MTSDLDFTGKSVLITGAASGIGSACAAWLAGHGASELVLVDIDGTALDSLHLDCETRRFAGDVSDPALWQVIESDVQLLDHAILNAGLADAAAITDIDFAQWRRLMSVNLDGMMLSLQCALRIMRRQDRGSVVLTASASGLKAEPGTAAYGCSKAGVVHLARVAAREAAPHGIRVNAIAPGGVDTPIWDAVPAFNDLVEQEGSREGAIAAMGQIATPLGRYARAQEIAGQVGFLLSDLAATVTGTALVSDGGYSA